MTTRYGGDGECGRVRLAAGWSIEHATAPSNFVGANGITFDAHGELFVAELFGSEISALRPDDGSVRVVSRTDDPITTPDDLAFDERGNMFITEFAVGRVSVREPGGHIRVLDDALPAANGICTLGNRLFVGEFRDGGRIVELFPDGGPRRVIVARTDWPNGMAASDDCLYYPCVLPGEIWRVPIAGGAPELVVSGLAFPNAVKIDGGDLLVALAGGDVVRVDIRTRNVRPVASLAPGNDNLALSPAGRLVVSNLVDGRISEIVDGAIKEISAPGFVGPFGLACRADGTVLVADAWSYAEISPDGALTRPSWILEPGFPGMVRSVAVNADGTPVFATTAGVVATCGPGGDTRAILSGLEEAVGIAVCPNGEVVTAEAATGRLVAAAPNGTARTLTAGLARPTGVAIADDGSYFVAESAAGRVSRVHDGIATSVLDGLVEPHGVAICADSLYVLDRGAKCLHRVRLDGSERSVIARGLPVGHAHGVRENVSPGLPAAPGPWFPFAGLAAAPDGSVYLAADGEGSVLKLAHDGVTAVEAA